MGSKSGGKVISNRSKPVLSRIQFTSTYPLPWDSPQASVVYGCFAPIFGVQCFGGAFRQEYLGSPNFCRLGEKAQPLNSSLCTWALRSLPRFQTLESTKFPPCLRVLACRCSEPRAATWAVYFPFAASPLVCCRCSTLPMQCWEMW